MRQTTTKYQLICNVMFVIFWVMATYNFITQELAGEIVTSIELGVRLIAQGVVIVLGLWTLRAKTDILILSIFLVYSFISTCVVNDLSLFMWIDGMRLYICFLFVIPIFRYLLADKQFRSHFVERVDRNLLRFLWIQIPCIILQMKYPHPDFCGGSLGWMKSGTISNLIYLVSFYLMLRAWDKRKSYFGNLQRNWILIFLLFPSFLNETKISFIFLMMYFFFLIPIDKKFLKNFTWILPGMMVLLGGALYLYSSVVGSNEEVTNMASATEYLIGNDDGLNVVEAYMDNKDMESESDLARGLKFVVVPAIMDRHPISWPFGYGIGNYKVGDSAKSVKFAKEYQWMLRGTMIESHFIWLELGLIGLGLYFIFWFIVLRAFRHKVDRNLQLQWFLSINVLLITVYNSALNELPFYFIFMYMIVASNNWHSLPPYSFPSFIGKRIIRWSLRAPVED